jgi:DNA-binding transcriptional ArsR family regulator
MAATTKINAGKGPKREIGEAISFAVAHEVRIRILVRLNEAPRSPSELARLVGVPLNTITHHITELVESNSIEPAGARVIGRRNVHETVYRSVKQSEYSAEELATMNPEEQRVTLGLFLQNCLAEHLAAFRSGVMRGNDPDLVLLWRWLNVDQEGREEIRIEQEEHWRRLQEIEARSVERRSTTKEEAQSIIVSSMGHPRVRPAPRDQPEVGGLVGSGEAAAGTGK